MDVIFETQKGDSFTIEIGYFDTVLEIKEKIEKYKEIPISHQTLFFNGKFLQDTGDVASCVILHNSHIRLIEKSTSPQKLKIKTEDLHCFSPNKKTTQLILKLPTKSHVHHKLSLDVDLSDNVHHLKEKLYQIDGFPNRPLAMFVNRNVELQDHKQLREYELTDGSEITVLIRPTSAPAATGMTKTVSTTSAMKLKVTVVTKCAKRLPVEVNLTDKVQVLRNELEKLQQRMNFQLPPDGYFFIYNQNVMEEQETFQWHNVRQDDNIEIFNGSVSGGS